MYIIGLEFYFKGAKLYSINKTEVKVSMKDERSVKLVFRTAENDDIQYIKNCGINAWYAVFGRTDDFDPDIFWSRTSRSYEDRHDNIQIALDGDTKVGILIIDSLQRDDPSLAHISLLYLEPAYRGRKLGVQFLDKASELARGRKLKGLRLYVAASNKRAVNLYTGYGFVCNSPLKRFQRQHTMIYRFS